MEPMKCEHGEYLHSCVVCKNREIRQLKAEIKRLRANVKWLAEALRHYRKDIHVDDWLKGGGDGK